MAVKYRLGPKSSPAQLLAALGGRLARYQDRDYVYIDQARRLVPHAAACRDFCCSACGAGLVTRMIEGDWRTVCAADAGHGQEGFVSKASYQRRQAASPATSGPLAGAKGG